MSLPPVRRPGRSALYDEDFLDELRENPGEWRWFENRDTRPSYGYAKKTIEGLQVATRKDEYGTYDVYARIERREA